MNRDTRTDAQWRELLTDEEYRITRQKGTERPFTGEYWEVTGTPGTYRCKCCGEPLFDASTKFDSGSGWPSFFEPLTNDKIQEVADNSLGQSRVEVVCNRCKAHLGHVFPDGPAPGGLRYCINSASLRFDEESKQGEQLVKD